MMTRRYTQPLLIFLLLVALIACAVLPGPPTPTPTTSPMPTPTPAPDAEEQYYRGAFDACGAIAVGVLKLPVEGAAAACYKFTLNAYQIDAYSEPTDGWRWPLAEPTPEKEARR